MRRTSIDIAASADPRFEDTARRHERARLETLRRDAARSPGANLEEGAALCKVAHEVAAAFRPARG